MLKQHRKSQRGAAMFTALILLIGLTLVALASLGTSLLELRMSGNEESAMTAHQSAQAGVDIVINDAISNQQFVTAAGNRGTTKCYQWPDACTSTIAAGLMPEPISASAASKIKITQVIDRGQPPRSRRFATSAKHFSAAHFEVESLFDKSGVGQGKATLSAGYLQLLPGSPTSSIPAAPQPGN